MRLLASSTVARVCAFRLLCFSSVLALLCSGCCGFIDDPAPKPAPVPSASQTQSPRSLVEQRKGFKTHLWKEERGGEPAPEPPKGANLTRVKYPSSVGELVAYVSPDPGDGARHPAVLWLFGGFGNDIGETAWEPAPADNDQSARAFREAGLLMMYPSERGGNDNPGHRECFFGEVDDVLAAADYLAQLPYVDAKRIYLGGHSTGGTLALLVAECTERFRAVFALGPVGSAASYGAENVPFDVTNLKELSVRSPSFFLGFIKSPTFILEGMASPGNADQLPMFEEMKGPAPVKVIGVPRMDHFSLILPATRLIAAKLKADVGASPQIDITAAEAAGLSSGGH